MRQINEIIVHCSATPEGRAVTAKQIDTWHKQRGFKCIGYHYVVYLDGTVVTGRAESEIGAHCLNHNAKSIGVCYIGGLAKDGTTAKDTRTDKQKEALLKLLKSLKAKYPEATIHGHREFAAKACPCFDAKEEYKSI
jgi:N-acetylmuramoyl-L-alanine amidase